MECDRALEALFEAMDTGTGAVADHTEALAHCDECPACARAVSGARRLGAIPAPEAPPALLARVLAAVEDERAAQMPASTEDIPPAQDESDLAEVVPLAAPVRTPRAFRNTVLVMAGAAVLVGAFFVMRAGIVAMTGGGGTASDLELASAPSLAESVPPAPLPEGFRGDVTSGAGADAGKLAREAPNLIAFDGWTYRLVPDVDLPERSTLATLGQTTSDLGSGTPGAYAVLGIEGAPQAVYVAGAEGTLRAFSLVTRTYAGKRFALESDKPVTRYGDWPQLPARFPAPTGADGGPTFRAATKPDDLGATVYPLPGTDPTTGFAIAPGLPATDPGGGNPGWTWWAPSP